MGGGFIVLRLVHISLGVFWAGGVLFMNFLVGPALAASGPDGVKVMAELNRRRYFEIVLFAAFLTIVSGLDLMRRDSGNFAAGWFHSSIGIGFTTGMIAAIVSFLIGLLAVRPAIKRMAALGAELAQAAPEARPGLMAAVGLVRARLIAFGSIGALFVLIAVMSMAVARYL